MRDILFRGKRTDNGKWVEGFYLQWPIRGWKNLSSVIVPIDELHDGCATQVEVDPSTVGQYTGLNDKNGKRVFEGDILRIAKKSDSLGTYWFPPVEYPVLVFVKFDLCAWTWETINDDKYYISFPEAWCHYECKVVGNLYDNPELLKGHTVVTAGNCTVCGTPLEDGSLFLCKDCQGKVCQT